MKKIEFIRFGEEDVPELTRIMKRAFDKDTQIHLGEETGGPDGYDNGEFLRKWGFDKNSTQFKLLADNIIIGGVILWINPNTQDNYLGTIFLDIDFQEKGIGQEVWRMIEKMYPDTKVWHTETPIFSHRNHNFYINKCGFYVVEIKNPKDMHEGSFIMEKRMK